MQNQPARLYQVGFTTAVMMFLITLTAVIVLIIIGNAQNTHREEEIQQTLTAAYAGVAATQRAGISTATPAPAVTYGTYAFAAADPVYGAADTCDRQMLAGEVRDLENELVDGFTIAVWGDYTSPLSTGTGEVARAARGRWRLPLGGMVNRRVWVQLRADNHYVSAPVEVVLDGADCEHNRVEIVFVQTSPLD
jgi:hypothetical protein